MYILRSKRSLIATLHPCSLKTAFAKASRTLSAATECCTQLLGDKVVEPRPKRLLKPYLWPHLLNSNHRASLAGLDSNKDGTSSANGPKHAVQ